MHQNQGTCTYVPKLQPYPIFISHLLFRAVKISTISQTPSQILANLKSALPAIIKNIKGEWQNIQSIHIKTNSSVSLPIWTCSLDDSEEGRWGGSAAVVNKEALAAEETEESGASGDSTASEGEEVHEQTDRKGKKRSLDDEDKTSHKKPKTTHLEVEKSKSPPKRSLNAVSFTSTKKAKTNAVPGSPPRPAVSVKMESKQKHRSSLAEKKAKIVKRKIGSKGAKERLLGKKAAQS
jgi:ribosome biogenesis protein UTP30